MKKKNKYSLTVFIALSMFNFAFSQEKHIQLSINSNPTDANYWWLEKNNFGIEPADLDFEIDWIIKTAKTEYKFRALYQEPNKIHINESYIKHNFSNQTFLRFGAYYRDFSTYLNDNLSSGSMLISKNAQPMPKIGLVTSKVLNENINLQLGMSHGFFDKSGRGYDEFYLESPFLHEKFIYMNIKKNQHEMGVGLVHEAIWAGSTPELGKQPSKLKDFFKVFISADGNDVLDDNDIHAHANALGSHLGIWDFYYQKTDQKKAIKLYYQHFFEDTSSFRFANSIDGLWGLELENYIPDTNILFEYLDTTHCCTDPPYQDDNYYSNYQYVAGWTYKNYVLGNPFIRNTAAFRELIKLFHIGIRIDKSSHYFQMQSSRKIHTKDDVKYKIQAGKKIKENLNIRVYFVKNNTSGLGFGLSYIL